MIRPPPHAIDAGFASGLLPYRHRGDLRGRWPDLVLLLTVAPETTARRMGQRELDRFERAGTEFHARVDAGFREMAAADPDRWVRVDGTGSIDDGSSANTEKPWGWPIRASISPKSS